jgi:hypothetical protein
MDISHGVTSFGSLIAFPVRGEKWAEKMLVGSGIVLVGCLIPILPLIFVYGYAVRIMLQAIGGDALELPGWRDWEKLASYGVRAMVIGLVFSLPAILVFTVGFGLYMMSTLALSAGDTGSGWPFGLWFFGLGAWMLSMPVGSVLMLLAAAVTPPALSHFAVNDRLSAAFYFKEWWHILAGNKLGYLVAWIFLMGVGGLVYWAIFILAYSFILCWLVPFLAAPLYYYLLIVGAALFGVCYRDGMIARYS